MDALVALVGISAHWCQLIPSCFQKGIKKCSSKRGGRGPHTPSPPCGSVSGTDGELLCDTPCHGRQRPDEAVKTPLPPPIRFVKVLHAPRGTQFA